MMHREIIAVCSCNNVKHINAFWGKVKRLSMILEAVYILTTVDWRIKMAGKNFVKTYTTK
jgi:hypothetical protein